MGAAIGGDGGFCGQGELRRCQRLPPIKIHNPDTTAWNRRIATRAIEIDADADVLAAARTVVQRSSDVGLEGQTATDFMWVAAQPVPTTAESTAACVAYAPGLGGAIVAYSPVSTTVTVLDGVGAVVAETPVAARTVARIPLDLPAGTAVSITGRAAWVVTVRQDPGFLAAMAPARPEVDPMEITTVDRSYVR